VYGQSVTITATVAAVSPGGGTPVGTVTFYRSGVIIGTGTLSTSGIATLALAPMVLPFTVGDNLITATYAGNVNYNGSESAAHTHTIDKANTTTTVTASPNPSVYGQSVTFRVTVVAVSPGGGTPAGTVEFFSNGASIGTATLDSSGAATLTLTPKSLPFAIGSNSITAKYEGNVNYKESASAAYTHTVNKANTTTTVTASPNPLNFGQSVTFRATVTVTSPGTGIPVGTVTFFSDGNEIGTGTLNASGVATLTISTLTVGSHPITVTYTGDANHNASTSVPLNQTVNNTDGTPPKPSDPDGGGFLGLSRTAIAIIAAVAIGIIVAVYFFFIRTPRP
jgi:hypothetical protein